MIKIPTIFVRDPDTHRVINEVVEGCEWVLDGEGVATVKFDGSACLYRDEVFYRRHRHKAEQGDPPKGWIHHSFNPEQASGHGWIPVGEEPASRWHREAFARGVDHLGGKFIDGLTYELCGPKVNSNPENVGDTHILMPHGSRVVAGSSGLMALVNRTYDVLGYWLEHTPVEGIVFHHRDGRMAKIKRRDFGLAWPVKP